MTAMMFDGSDPVTENVTEHMRYELPPEPEGRFHPQFDGYGRYRLPHPERRTLTGFTRASTIAKILDDTYGLDKWQKRNILLGVVNDPSLIREAAKAVENEAKAGVFDAIAENAQIAAGSAEARELGTAVHAWAEAVDHGTIMVHEVPHLFRIHVMQYLQALARHAIAPMPEYTERIVYNSDAEAVGTLDRIYMCPDGTLALGDVKTSKSLEYSYLSYAIQLRIYQSADYMLSLDGKRWEPMPQLRDDFAILAHVPSNDPHKSSLVTFDLKVADTALRTATLVRKLRAQAKKTIPNVHALPIPDAVTARQHAAVLALRTSVDVEALPGVMAEYQDVWNDDLNTLGHAVFEALTK